LRFQQKEIGLADVREAILASFHQLLTNETGLLITDARHYDLLCRTSDELRFGGTLLKQGASEELVLVGMHNGLRFLGAITGRQQQRMCWRKFLHLLHR